MTASDQSPTQVFHSDQYLRHNARRLEHLTSLRIPVAGLTVLEVGAGIGDHSHYFLDRGCRVTITEARRENIDYLKQRYPKQNVRFLDMESPQPLEGAPFDVVHCYGLLYHLSNPKEALTFLSANASKLLLLETCVSFNTDSAINPIDEAQENPSQAFSGKGCRPTRAWLFAQLKQHFDYVYLPKTQPWHEEFPLDWTAPQQHRAPLQRAVFIASRKALGSEALTPTLIMQHQRHG